MNLEFCSDRLRLTPLSWSDFDLALEMFTDPEVMRYVGDLMDEEIIRAGMPDSLKRGGDGWIGIWCVSERESGEKLGTAFLLPMPVEEDDIDYSLVIPGKIPDGDIEIGYCFKRSAWGQGYATEACSRLVRFAFEQTPLDEIVASFYDEHEASRNVLRKVGFIDRGTMRCYGEDADSYRITRQEWTQPERSCQSLMPRK
ncbi:MAG: GNAT family N-acetyltransferase [Paracoccaceae bacterium]|uniref:GNAT family N-acetyltransferase n=1 Tax=Parasphingorhabdus sp. TaxID=2709688 RepID=UPI0032758624